MGQPIIIALIELYSTTIVSNSDHLLTRKIVLLYNNKLVISLLNYENMTLEQKETIHLEGIICIDFICIDNYLYDAYKTKNF